MQKQPFKFGYNKPFAYFCIVKKNKDIQVGAIAQLVEQRTENPCVPGSIPGGTTTKTGKTIVFPVFVYKEQNILFFFSRLLAVYDYLLFLNYQNQAEVAQLVEHQLPKLRVAGSSPVFRSKAGSSRQM